MLLGTMNNPARPLEIELERIAAAGYDLVDVTLEPPGAWPVDGRRLGERLRELGLQAVGHTAYYLPIASAFPELREEAHARFRATLDVFADAGITLANVHPDPLNRLFTLAEVRARNAEAVARLADDAAERGIRLMVENLGRSFAAVDDLQPLFDAAPALGFHLDVAHANMWLGRGEPNRTAALLAAFADRLAHVHVSDNLGGEDLHLPLGTGTVDWAGVVSALKQAGWDGTVALEVFSPRLEYVALSRELWLAWWAAG